MNTNEIRMSYSDDGGYTWSSWEPMDIHALGEYGQKVSYTRLGSFYSRTYRFQVSARRKRDIIDAVGFVEVTEA